jgi:hypothetical protein
MMRVKTQDAHWLKSMSRCSMGHSPKAKGNDLKIKGGGWGGRQNWSLKVNLGDTLIYLSIKSSPVGPELHPSFDASSPPGCCTQSHEILLNQGMKYWDSALNARGARTFIATIHKAKQQKWLGEGVQEKQGQGKLGLAPNLLLNWVSCPVEAQCTLFFPLDFWKLIPYVTTKEGVLVPSFSDFTNNTILPKFRPQVDCVVQK